MNETHDLITLVERDLGPGRKYGRWTVFRCPFHDDHSPSLGVTNGQGPRGAYWKCFAASCGKSGGLIQWVMTYHDLSYEEACEKLVNPHSLSRLHYPSLQTPLPEYPPGQKWQSRAWQLIDRARKVLWENQETLSWPETSPKMGEVVWRRATALEYLTGRGLSENTLHLWHIGLIPKTFADSPNAWGLDGKKVWISNGILIPCIAANQVWYLKIRLPNPKPHKYTQIRGSRPAVYLVQTLENHTKAVFCEGELDTLLLWQECDALAGAVSLGSAGNELNVATWGFHFLHVEEKYVAYDLDQSGAAGADKLAWLKPHPLSIPKLRPCDKDLTDFYLSGGDLKSWLKSEMTKTTKKAHKTFEKEVQNENGYP